MRPRSRSPRIRAARPLRRRAAAALTFALLALTASSCGDDAQYAEVGSAALVPTEVARPWETGESRLVHAFETPDTLGEWRATAPQAHVTPYPRKEPTTLAVEMRGGGQRYLDIPLPADLEEWNQITLDTLSPVHSFVRVRLVAEGDVLFESPQSTVIGRPFQQELTVDLVGARGMERKPEKLRLMFSGGANRTIVWNISLRYRPWESWAADFDGESSRPVIDEVTRPGSVIATDNAHRAEFDVPESGELLFFAAASPRLSSKESELELAVRLTAGDKVEERTFDLGDANSKFAEWTRCAMNLSSLSGERVAAEFELRSTHAGKDYAFLSDLSVFARSATTRTVLFVTSDTHRADHVGVTAGSVAVETPTLDAIGARGIVFDDCYSSTNITVPSHVALLTATLPRDTLVLDNMSGIADEARTLAESYHEAGYATFAAVSGPQLQHAWSGLGQGFDAMACPSRQTWDGEKTIGYLKEMVADAEGRDVFVWLHLFDAHRPYDRENRYIDKYWDKDKDPSDPALPDPAFPVDTLTAEFQDVRDPEYLNSFYKAEVTYVDHLLSQVMDIDRFRDGLVAVTADHGECLGEYDVWWDHVGMYPENLHVPLVISGPGVPQGRRVTGPVIHLDIGRTLLDLSGLQDSPFPGESMLRHLEVEPDSTTPRFGLSSHAKTGSLEMDGWFCTVHLRAWRIPGREARIEPHSVELYDLRPGGDALKNVAYEEVERASRMRGLILDWLSDQQPTGWVEQDQANDADRIGQVQALGYTAEATDGTSIWIDADCDCEPCTTFARH